MWDQNDAEYDYEPLFGARYERFHKAFPASEYGIVITHELLQKPFIDVMVQADPAAASRLISEAMQHPTFVFEATLIHRESGEVIRNAHAVRIIYAYKDYEVGETAARQRVVAAAGFDGGSMASDEAIDRKGQGALPGCVAPDAAGDQTTTQVEPADVDCEPCATENQGNPRTAVTSQQANGNAPKAMINQIRHHVRIKGLRMEVPDELPLPTARDMLKDVMSASVASSH